MKGLTRLVVFAALLATGAWGAPKPKAGRAPVVVELYTAQGCVSCGAADVAFDRLADRTDVIALGFSVDYWDYLGWKDTFAKPEFAERQRAFDRRLGPIDVYTPQVIVGGQWQSPGDRADDIAALIDRAQKGRAAGPAISQRGDTATIGEGRVPPGGAEIWLVRFDPRIQTIQVTDGDNKGKTLERRNVVRQLARLGGWTGRATRVRLPASPESGLATVIILEGRRGGPILAARANDPESPRSVPRADERR